MTSRDQALAWARRGTAYFIRALNTLPDAGYAAPSLVGWTRAELAAHVGYNARALCRLLEWAATGVEQPMYTSAEQRAEEIAKGGTLTPAALRHLVTHSAIHLDVEWRDLPDDAWDAEVRTAQGRVVPAAETLWMRAREVWVHAVDLDTGAAFSDFPPDYVDALLRDVAAAWQRRDEGTGLVLAPSDRDHRVPVGNGTAEVVVTGTAAGLVRWATGRGADAVAFSCTEPVLPPRWL